MKNNQATTQRRNPSMLKAIALAFMGAFGAKGAIETPLPKFHGASRGQSHRFSGVIKQQREARYAKNRRQRKIKCGK